MNRCTPAAKIIEYAAAGIVPISTLSMGEYGKDLQSKDLGIIFDNIEDISSEDYNQLNEKLKKGITEYQRNNLSIWAKNFSYEETSESYKRQLIDSKII